MRRRSTLLILLLIPTAALGQRVETGFGSDGLLQTTVGIASAIRGAPARYPAIIVMPQVPADSGDAFAAMARRLGRLPTWIFHRKIDPVVPVSESRRAALALEAAGGDVRYTEFLGGGHNVWDAAYASPQFQEWLFAQRRSR